MKLATQLKLLQRSIIRELYFCTPCMTSCYVYAQQDTLGTKYFECSVRNTRLHVTRDWLFKVKLFCHFYPQDNVKSLPLNRQTCHTMLLMYIVRKCLVKVLVLLLSHSEKNDTVRKLRL